MPPAGFEWDEKKRRSNLRKHRIDFDDVANVFHGPNVDDIDPHHSDGEERRIRLLWLRTRVVFVVYTERAGRIRIISARPAEEDETAVYLESNFGKFLD